MSSNGVEPQEECPICIRVFGVEFARPEKCQHRFHRACLREWSKFKVDCPMCRVSYERVFVYEQHDDKRKLIATDNYEAPGKNPLDEEDLFVGMNPYDHTHCRVCGGGDHEESILMCDDCDEGYHLWCLDPPLTEVPNTDRWFCTECSHRQQGSPEEEPVEVTHRGARMVRRTALAERVVNTIRRVQVSSEEESSSESEGGEEVDNDIPDFDEMDRMVLDGDVIDHDVQLPSVSRRRKTKKKKVKSPKKKRSTPTALRRQTRKSRKTSKRSSKARKSETSANGECSSRRDRAEIPTFSLTGAGMAHFVDEDEGQQPESPPPMAQETDCDLLGSIIEEQEKVLTPGNLLKIQAGKFEKGDGYQEFQSRVHSKMTGQLKESLGMSSDSQRMNFWEREEGSRSRHSERHNSDMEISYELDAEVEEQLRLQAEAENEQLVNLQKKAIAQMKKEAFEKKLLERRQKEQETRENDRYRIEREKEQKVKESRRRERERFDRKERDRMEREDRRRREKEERDRDAEDAERSKRNDETRRKSEKRSRGDEKEKKSKSDEKEKRSKKDDKERSHKSSREKNRDRRDRDDRNGKDRSERRPRDERNGRSNRSPAPVPPPPMPASQPIVPMAFPPALNPLNAGLHPDVQHLLLFQQLVAAGQNASFGMAGLPAAPMVVAAPPPLPQGPPPALHQKPVEAPAKAGTKHEISKDDLVPHVDEIAKKYAKKYLEARKIDSEGYKKVMRTVVKECVKRKITNGERIFSKVQKAVHDIKKGKL